jgi:hypothetical protein
MGFRSPKTFFFEKSEILSAVVSPMVPTSKCQGSRAAPRDDDDVWGAWPSTTADTPTTCF